MSLVDRLPLPSLRTQKILAIIVILTQGGIAVTGAIVRVTASGLGCPTWPQCFPGSFTPVGVAEVPFLHQAVEFGNRLLTFVVVLPRRPEEARAALDTRRCSPMHVLIAATSCARQAAPPRIRRAGARCTVQRT